MARIITVIGLVPGAGATFISTNVAAFVASEGASALLIDYAPRGVLGALYMAEAARESVHPTIETWRDFVYPGGSLLRTSYGLAVLPGRPIAAEKRENPPGQVNETLDHFAPGFDVVVIDAGGDPYLPHVGQCIEKSDLGLVVAEPTQRCFQAIPENKRIELSKNQNLWLIVNRISKGSYYHPRDIARWYGFEHYIAVPEDTAKVNDATKKRLPLVLYGKGKACAILRQISENEPDAVVKRVMRPVTQTKAEATLAEAGVEPDEISGEQKQAGGKGLLGKLAGKFKRGRDQCEETIIPRLPPAFTTPENNHVVRCYKLTAQAVERVRARAMKMREDNQLKEVTPEEILHSLGPDTEAVFIPPDLKLLKEIRRDPKSLTVPVFVVSRYDRRFIEAGADDCVEAVDDIAIERARAQSEKMKALWNKANRDPLTGCYTRAFLDAWLEEKEAEYKKTGVPFTVLICDLDHFKTINDKYGHPAGDAVLKEFASFLRDKVRRTDVVARYGGEEFVIVFPGTGIREAGAVAEKLRHAWERHVIMLPSGEKMSCTFSAGVAGFGRNVSNVEAVINAADKALYRSKEAGRNRVSVAGGGRVEPSVGMTGHGRKAPRIITVWSPLTAGKTFVAANFAAVLTWKGYSVVLVVTRPEIEWYNARPVPLERVAGNPAAAWKMGGQCEEIPGVMLVSGNVESIETLKQLPCDVVVVDGGMNAGAFPSDLLIAVAGPENGGVAPPEGIRAVVVANRVEYPPDGQIAIPERVAETARGMRRGLPPVIFSKELADAFVKLETAAGL